MSMNTLKEINNQNFSPASSPSNMDLENSVISGSSEKSTKTPLKKEELEKIAKELKKKLSKASITAKQQQQQNSPGSKIGKLTHSNVSPLKEYVSKKNFESPNKFNYLLSSSPLYSPNNKSPTHMRSSAAASLLSSSPIIESPIKKSNRSSPLKNQPTMVLQSVENTPSKASNLKPSPPLSSKKSSLNNTQQTTPTLPKKQLNVNTSSLLKTPTQPKSATFGNNDDEGAELLMYLATSPSPAKTYFPNTPKLGKAKNQAQPQLPTSQPHNGDLSNTTAPNSSFSAHKHTSSNSSANSFMAPPPPLTPKRHINTSSKTPQNRLTPSMNLFNTINNNTSGLPSSGLALTPAGFNMNDYVNFFSPSPGGANLSRNMASNFLKTPDFNNLLANATQNNQSKVVDGKMINFDKVGLFKNSDSKE